MTLLYPNLWCNKACKIEVEVYLKICCKHSKQKQSGLRLEKCIPKMQMKWQIKQSGRIGLWFVNIIMNRRIKHDFPLIYIRKVPREVLKIEGEARGTLQILMNDKTMFDSYYCINSTKTLRK